MPHLRSMGHLAIWIACCGVPLPAMPAQAPDSASPALTLRQALELARASDPGLERDRERATAAEALVDQARRWPNPEFELEFENLAGSDAYAGGEALEQTYALSQTLELGGKRRLRSRAAEADEREARALAAARERNLDVQVATSFRQALLASARRELALEQHVLAQQVLETVRRRVEAGKAADVELASTRASLSQVDVELQRAQRRLEAERAVLATWLGREAETPLRMGGDIFLPEELPSREDLAARLDKGAALEAVAWEAESHRASAALEASQRIPNPTVFAGLRRSAEQEGTALVAGVSIPLPILDGRRGAEAAASARARALDAERRHQLRARQAALARAWEDFHAARAELDIVEQATLPSARRAFEMVSEGYTEGKIGYLAVLDAQRLVVDATRQRLDAVESGWDAISRIEAAIESLLFDSMEKPANE